MSTFQKVPQQKRGSALLTVVMLTAMFAILTASMLSYSIGERRGNERNRLILRAKNMAENIALYSAEQLIPKLNRMGSAPVGVFPWTGTSANRVYMPPNIILNTAFTTSTVGMEMRAGIESASPYALINDITSPNNGLQVSTSKIPIIARATATHSSLGSVHAYTEQDMQLSITPLFQFGLFYNMDLELFPGQDMTIAGPVHTNKRLTARGEQGGTATVTFTHRITAAEGLYADGQMKATYVKRDGSTSAGAGGTGGVFYQPVATPLPALGTNLQSSGGVWRDHKYGTASETTTTQNQFRTFATTTYGGNVRTNAHGVSKLELPGIGSYSETNLASTPEDDRNSGRQLIEPRDPIKWNGTSWVVDPDDNATKELKFSRKAGLYLVVNPDDDIRWGKLPDGANQPVLPRSYRAWLNIINGDGTHTLREVVLPGQPSYGYNDGGTPGTTVALMADDTMYSNVLPNRYTNGTAVGSNQVLRTAQNAYELGRSYLINNAAGYAIGATDLALDTGTGIIEAGDTVTIGAFNYLVVADQTAAGVIRLAPPGLRVAVVDNAAVAVAPLGVIGTAAGGTNYWLVGGHSIGATSLSVDNTVQTVLPGNTVTIGTSKYLVTSTPTAAPASAATVITITIAPPGLRVGALNDATVVTELTSGSLGTAKGYQTAFPYAAGINNLMLDTGTGTIQPGNRLYIDGNTYLVASLPTGAVTSGAVSIIPALSAAIVDDTLVTVDPLPNTGYYVSGGSGDNFPAEAATRPFQAEAYFFDLRRANGNVGYNSNIAGGGARGTTNYAPRAIAKIDFDMARFKMMFDRTVSAATTSTGYNAGVPTATNWTNSIFNAAGITVALDLGMDVDNAAAFAYTSFPAAGTPETINRPDPFRLYYTPAYLAPASPGVIPADPRTLAVPAADLALAWYDGIAIYIHSVEAERRAQTITAGKNDRVDSGVRLINGRGPLASYTTATKTGFSFATNDAAYIIGHYNADGTIVASGTGSGTPNFYNGFSATYPDSANERLAAVMADAITLLSQPVFSSASTPYFQTHGWNDALSAFRGKSTSWTDTWRSVAPTSANSYEGLGTSATASKPGALPTSSTPGTGGATTWQTKLPPPAATEFSTAMLMGIVPSNHNATGLTDRPPLGAANAQYSGGAHNFPRLLEDWHCDLDTSITGNANLYIRGSMVALFESRVAMEPWNIRCYAAPNRFWGLHYGFTQPSHDIPLEPLVIGADRLGFRELTAAEYASRKTFLEGLTTIP